MASDHTRSHGPVEHNNEQNRKKGTGLFFKILVIILTAVLCSMAGAIVSSGFVYKKLSADIDKKLEQTFEEIFLNVGQMFIQFEKDAIENIRKVSGMVSLEKAWGIFLEEHEKYLERNRELVLRSQAATLRDIDQFVRDIEADINKEGINEAAVVSRDIHAISAALQKKLRARGAAVSKEMAAIGEETSSTISLKNSVEVRDAIRKMGDSNIVIVGSMEQSQRDIDDIKRRAFISIRESMKSTQAAGFATLTIAAGFILIPVILLALYLTRSITKPISVMMKALGRMSGGDLSVRMGINSSDEIGVLAQTFDAMMVNLQQVTASRDDLDNEVKVRIKAEKELKLFSDRLRESNRELTNFAYIASHDLQEPLRKVTGFGGRLKAKYADRIGEDGRDYIDRMMNAASRMQELIEGLLDYSRVTTKARPFIATDLSTIVHEVMSDLEIRIEQTGAQVELNDLPTIDADPLQMRQLFQNLIGNAIKFTRPGQQPVVVVSSECYGHGTEDDMSSHNAPCTITVQDNGIGFDEKYTDRIFGVFQRLHGRTEYEGTGIGLSVCKKIVERHGGNITAKSAPGKGSTFIITMPSRQHVQ